MAIDKAIRYRQQAAFGGIMGRDGRRKYGGGSDYSQVADSSGKKGTGTGGYQGGPLGGYGDAGSSNNPSGERYRESRQEYQQAVNTAAAIEAAKKAKREETRKNTTKFGYAKPKNKFSGILGTIVGMMMGFPGLGLLTGGFDKLKGGLGNLNETLGNFREKTTGFKTQAEYDAARQQRQLQGRLNNMYDRKTKGKNFSQQNMDMLEAMGLQPSTAQNVLTGRDLKGFTESRMGLQTPQTFSDPFANTVETTANTINDSVPQGTPFNNPVGGVDQYAKEMEALESMVSPPLSEFNLPGLSYNIPINEMGGTVQQYYTQNPPDKKYLTKDGKIQIYNDGINFNTQPQGINTIDVGYPSNDLMAELSQKQLDFLNQPINQKSLKDSSFGLTPKQIFDKLPSYEEKPFFGTNQEPTTSEEYNQYLDSIGVPRMTAADGGLASMFTRRG
jgi:hypothetical protein